MRTNCSHTLEARTHAVAPVYCIPPKQQLAALNLDLSRVSGQTRSFGSERLGAISLLAMVTFNLRGI